MRRYVQRFRAFAAVVAAFGLLAPDAFAASATLDRIKEHGTIVFSHRNAAPPFSYRDREGQIQGYSVDLCIHVADASFAVLSGPVLASSGWFRPPR